MTHLKYQTICGWKGGLKNSYLQNELVRVVFSFLTALVIVLIVGKVLGLLDNALSNRFSSYERIFSIGVASAAEPEGFKMIQSHRQINILKNKGFTFVVGFKNNGTKNWNYTGTDATVIKPSGDLILKHKFWGEANIAGKMSEKNLPGRIGYFNIPIQTPNKFGVFSQTFALYKGSKKISDDFVVTLNSWDSEEEVRMKAKTVNTVNKVNENPTTVNKVNTSSVTGNNEPIIRIGLFSNDQPQTIISSGPYKIVDSNNNILKDLFGSVTLDYLESNGQYMYSVNGQPLNANSYLKLIPNNADNVFEITTFENRPGWNQKLNDNTFFGNLEIRYSQKTNKTWLINELPMETYLKGLAEVSNDGPAEYQKAMNIAARTYATHHLNKATKHADEYFILDSVYDQVYKGQNMQKRQPNTVAAVEATTGQVVTYDGEVAITPYFSWSDGRTRSMKEVWNSDKPWLQSVVEPAGYDKTTLYGHGVGMSARGAVILARDQNYSYERILKYYYQGITLKNNYNR